MNASSAVLEKIDALPDHVKEQLFHYVEFLYEIYGPDHDDSQMSGAGASDDVELSEEGRRLLEDRVKKALANPEKRKHWRDVATQIQERYKSPYKK